MIDTTIEDLRILKCKFDLSFNPYCNVLELMNHDLIIGAQPPTQIVEEDGKPVLAIVTDEGNNEKLLSAMLEFFGITASKFVRPNDPILKDQYLESERTEIVFLSRDEDFLILDCDKGGPLSQYCIPLYDTIPEISRKDMIGIFQGTVAFDSHKNNWVVIDIERISESTLSNLVTTGHCFTKT